MKMQVQTFVLIRTQPCGSRWSYKNFQKRAIASWHIIFAHMRDLFAKVFIVDKPLSMAFALFYLIFIEEAINLAELLEREMHKLFEKDARERFSTSKANKACQHTCVKASSGRGRAEI